MAINPFFEATTGQTWGCLISYTFDYSSGKKSPSIISIEIGFFNHNYIL
jgi:hypothetical protein